MDPYLSGLSEWRPTVYFCRITLVVKNPLSFRQISSIVCEKNIYDYNYSYKCVSLWYYSNPAILA
jgi:hypothetical protein